MPAHPVDPVHGAAEPAVTVAAVSKRYARELRRGQRSGVSDIVGEVFGRRGSTDQLRSSEFWALRDVSLSVQPGEAVGIIGRNGAGKSTLLRIVAGITQPTTGACHHRGRLGSLLDPSVGFNTVLSGRENVQVAYSLLRGEAPTDEIIDEIAAYASLVDAMDHPVRTYSQGMRLRLGFATIVHVDPDVLVIDEALAVGDTQFQMQCLEYLHSFRRAGGAVIFVSHSLWLFQNLGTRGVCIDAGKITMDGSTEEVADHYVAALQRGTWDDVGEGPDPLEREYVRRRVGPSDHDPVDGDDVTAAETEILSASQRRPVRFAEVRCTRPSGGAPRTGDPLAIDFVLDPSEAVARAELAFTIWTADLSICLTADVMPGTGSPSISTFELAAGRQCIVRCVVEGLPLLAGEYAVRAAVYDAATSDVLGLIGFEDSPHWLRVAPADEAVDASVRAMADRLRPLRELQASPLVAVPPSGSGSTTS